ncbi:MAG: penicillin-binding protein 2 [Hyphomicrobiaceae bacterium]
MRSSARPLNLAGRLSERLRPSANPTPEVAATPATPLKTLRATRLRLAAVAGVVALLLAAIAGQLVRFSLIGRSELRTAAAETLTHSYSRPDIIDRNGRIIATDVAGYSLYADPAMLLDADEATEDLAAVLPEIDPSVLRPQLADRSRRFVWIKRGLTPREAQTIHDLGLPGLGFRRELKRIYPAGKLVGHISGQVDPDNRGISGIERFLDEQGFSREVQGAHPSRANPVRLSLDLGAQHALADELAKAAESHQAKGAAGVVIDVGTGEVLASYSWPPVDPGVPGSLLDTTRPDRVQGGVYELGSILKTFTVAMMLDAGLATLEKTYDVSQPLTFGRHQIHDLHGHAGRLSVRDIFVRSSNIGSAMMALEAGAERQRAFLERIGLINAIRTEAGLVAPPLLPQRWGEVETATIAFGHGMAAAPMQLAAAAASLVNGGRQVAPTYLSRAPNDVSPATQVVSGRTSSAIRQVMRLNVTMPYGTGRRAAVQGYRVGGKTGTAEIAGKDGYRAKSVVASFLATFPTDSPRFVVLISLFEPKPSAATNGAITAGVNAAPLTASVVARIAPILGVLPRRVVEAQ